MVLLVKHEGQYIKNINSRYWCIVRKHRTPPQREVTKGLSPIMSLLCYVVVLAVCSLVALCFNVRMLLSGFSDKTKQSRRLLVICQFVTQVTMLAVNMVEAWTELDEISIQHEEPCFAFYKLVSTFAAFFSGGILLALVAVESDHSESYQNQEALPQLLASAALALGFVGSGITWLHSCFSQEFASAVTVSAFILVSAIAVLLFVAWKTRPDRTAPRTSPLLSRLKKNGEIVLFVIFFLVCVGVMTSQISRPSLCESEQARAGDKVFYLFIMNYTVGIVMPVAVIDLNDSSYIKENEEMKVELI